MKLPSGVTPNTIEADLIRDEGIVLQVYRDHLGNLTLGIGRLVDDSKPGSGITVEEALYLLRRDIAAKTRGLDLYLPWWRTLTDARQRVLLNMAFNLGIGGLRKFVATLDAIKRGDYESAAKGMLASKWARQVPARAARLAEMMRNG